MSRPQKSCLFIAPVLFALAVPAADCHGETGGVLCDGGFGVFQWRSTTGVTVSVGAPKSEGFAIHACQAKLSWGQQELVAAPQDAQIDVDAVDVDLGVGVPVVALQIKKSAADKFMSYEIYSLSEPPQRLRVINGGEMYSAADTDLDGRVEIGTEDAAAVDGFEEIPLSSLDFAPPMMLRFERKQLIDVSAQFRPEYDRRIAALRAQLDDAQVKAFRQSDGTLKALFPPLPMEWARLRRTKVIVLEIVWCYLYSGRQQEAWNTLAEMWPPSDLDRIRAAILDARARGIAHEVDGVSSETDPRWKKAKAAIYNAPLDKTSIPIFKHPLSANAPIMSDPDAYEAKLYADTLPMQILLRRPMLPPGSNDAMEAAIPLNIVVDSAGKVRAAKSLGRDDQELLRATAGWKFVPASKGGHPVACKFRIDVSPAR